MSGKAIILIIAIFMMGWADEPYYMNGKKKVFLKRLSEKTRSQTIGAKTSKSKWYITKNGEKISIGDKILVKFAGEKIGIDSFCKQYGLSPVGKYGERWYAFEVDRLSDTLTLANRIYEDPHVRFAMPDIAKVLDRR